MLSRSQFHAFVLSAGFGTRLAPLTDEIPKPLVPVGNEPVLGASLKQLQRAGAARLFVNVHHHAQEITNYIESLGFDVQVISESSIRGTAGGIAGAKRHLDGAPLIVVNGDIVGKLPITSLLARATSGLVLALVPRAVGVGTVGVGRGGVVVRLRGEFFGEETSSGDYMGVACLGPQCVSTLPAIGCLVGDWALPLLRVGGEIQTHFVETEFEDIGDPRAYLSANMRWLENGSPALSPAGALIASSANIGSGVQIQESIVGADCRVDGSGLMKNCVILPGARVLTPLSDAIVTPRGVVMQVEPLAE